MVLPTHTITYSWGFLLSLRYNVNTTEMDTLPNAHLPPNGRLKTKKHGSRGGVRNRLQKQGSRHPLPVITLSNIRSLNNKMDEVTLLIKWEEEEDFRRSNLICFTETRLNEDCNMDIEGFGH
ncbi:hypothetical protein LDENG_00151290 [Lucifuga dentata]|nr:hypothetical protein LDENG_00151290 [Lucifuga dentata]